MKPILITGSTIVTFALVCYSAAFFIFHRKRQISGKVLLIQTIALTLDITATTLMIIGSENSPFTLHGMLGYSALAVMILDTIFFWSKRESEQLRGLLRYSTVAYTWWVLAYITGSTLAMMG